MECRNSALGCRKNTLKNRSQDVNFLRRLDAVPLNPGGSMSRPTCALLALLAVSFALAASACADSTAPRPAPLCDYSSSNTCVTHDYSSRAQVGRDRKSTRLNSSHT